MYGIFNIFNKERNLNEEVFVGKQMISAVAVIYFFKNMRFHLQIGKQPTC